MYKKKLRDDLIRTLRRVSPYSYMSEVHRLELIQKDIGTAARFTRLVPGRSARKVFPLECIIKLEGLEEFQKAMLRMGEAMKKAATQFTGFSDAVIKLSRKIEEDRLKARSEEMFRNATTGNFDPSGSQSRKMDDNREEKLFEGSRIHFGMPYDFSNYYRQASWADYFTRLRNQKPAPPPGTGDVVELHKKADGSYGERLKIEGPQSEVIAKTSSGAEIKVGRLESVEFKNREGETVKYTFPDAPTLKAGDSITIGFDPASGPDYTVVQGHEISDMWFEESRSVPQEEYQKLLDSALYSRHGAFNPPFDTDDQRHADALEQWRLERQKTNEQICRAFDVTPEQVASLDSLVDPMSEGEKKFLFGDSKAETPKGLLNVGKKRKKKGRKK